ncbi:MAG: hypothetical protein VW257_09455, partial [Quisquiliibacterium sp.]
MSNVNERPEEDVTETLGPEEIRRRRELLQESRELVIARLSKAVGDALTKMTSDLSSLALDISDPGQQGLLLNAVQIIKQNRSEIELRFRRSFTNVFERRLFNRKSEDAAAGPGESMLE